MNDTATGLGSAGFGLMFFMPGGTIPVFAMSEHDKTIHLQKNILKSSPQSHLRGTNLVFGYKFRPAVVAA
jgi:hypothetical protein